MDGLVSSGDITLEFAGVNIDPSGARYLTFNNTDTTLVTGQPLGGINWEANETYTGINASIRAYASGNTGSAELRIYTGQETEAMRIDLSGNLLVGKTDVLTATAGHAFMSNGQQRSTNDGDTVAILNRETSDGIIQQFRKDNSVVGNIGTDSGNLSIDTINKTGLLFAGNVILPKNNGAISDNTVDLGRSSERYKDLYLSGGVYLGGTVGANLLNDYEEGSYTVQLFDASSGGNASATTRTGYYTKIGNQVTVRFDALNNINTAGMTGTNIAYLSLPFSASLTGRSVGSVITDNLDFTAGRTAVAPLVTDSASRAYLSTTGAGVTDSIVTVQDINSGSTDIHTFTLTYFTT